MVAQQLVYGHFLDGGFGCVKEKLRCFLIQNFGHRWGHNKGTGNDSAKYPRKTGHIPLYRGRFRRRRRPGLVNCIPGTPYLIVDKIQTI